MLILLVLGIVGLLTTLGGIYLRMGKERSLDGLRERAAAECKWRLECVAPSLEGKVDGPTLRTAQGTIELIPSNAPSSWVIDMTTFDAEVGFTQVLNVVAHQDAARSVRSRVVRPVDLEDPKTASGHRVFSTDAEFARAVVKQRPLLKGIFDGRQRDKAFVLLIGRSGKGSQFQGIEGYPRVPI